jgi:RHS repeat-associated protein
MKLQITTTRIGITLLSALALCLGGLTASADDTRYYVNDHLATTVGIADAAGEIAALEADAFGAPLAAGQAPSRYTGKPYDEDMGAFVFPFRNYRPQEGRWMSADPSGFPDGVNGGAYAPNVLNGLDPLGLASKVTQSSFTTNGSAGGLSFTNRNTSALAIVGNDISFSRGIVDISLSSSHNTRGWIVQNVNFNYNYKVNKDSTNTNWSINYWEAWSVSILPSGEVVVEGGGARDVFETKDFSGTYSGTATITGTAYFAAYSTATPFNPDTWGPNVAQAGGLSSILASQAPSWLPTTNGISHSLSLEWKE